MPTHSITRTFVAGGTTEYPTRAVPLTEHYGTTLLAGDGTPTLVRTSTKRRWRYEWDSPDPAIVARWRTRFEAGATFSHTDPHGATYTSVMPFPDGWAPSYEYEPASSNVDLTLYKLTVQVWER